MVTFRPVPEGKVELVRELSARYRHAHGAPVHIGDPKAIGIADLGRPEFGDPTPIYPGEVPMFWACGVTTRAVALRAKVDFMITHEPAQMFGRICRGPATASALSRGDGRPLLEPVIRERDVVA